MSFSRYFENGQKGTSENWNKWFGDFFNEGIMTGFALTDAGGLNVEVSAGTAYVKDANGLMYQVVSSATETLTAIDNATRYINLHCNNGAYLTLDSSSTTPDDAITLGLVTAASGDITVLTDYSIGMPGAFPPGGIIAWSGTLANIPSGWLLCDGNNNTPNLVGRFLRGVNSAVTNPGTTGGYDTRSLGTSLLYTCSCYTTSVCYGGSWDNRPAFYEVAFIMKV
jgi:hypothetical protein